MAVASRWQLRQVTGYRRLTESEELAALMEAKRGDYAAAVRVVEANIGLAWRFALRYFRADPRLDPEDVAQDLIVGVFDAIERFRPDRGFDDVLAAFKACVFTQFRTVRNRSRSSADRFSADRLERWNEPGTESGDPVPPIPRLKRLMDSVAALPDRESFVIRRRFGLDGCHPMTLAEVAREMGACNKVALKYERRALERLKEGMTDRRKARGSKDDKFMARPRKPKP